MTNFEKWKQELSVEDAVEAFVESLTCEFCPANQDCRPPFNKCVDAFKGWAENESE